MSGMEDFFTTARRVKEDKPAAEKKSAPRTATPKPVSPKVEPVQEMAPQVESEEQKRYPERTFDRFIQKGARLRAEDIDLLKVFCSEITRAKRLLPYESRSNKRITDNTVLRVLLQVFCEKIEDQIDLIDFKGIQTEADLRKYIEETLNF